MRTIKFRGKSLFRGEWRVGSLITCANGRVFIVEAYEYVSDDSMLYWEVDPATVGQFTGLTDKDGKEIYEGDIVKFVHEIGRYKGENVCKVIYDEEFCSAFSVEISKTERYPFSLDFPAKCVEVIGNIHDNPELME